MRAVTGPSGSSRRLRFTIVIAALVVALGWTLGRWRAFGRRPAIAATSAAEERANARRLAGSGELARAVPAFRDALAIEDDPVTRRELANALLALGRAQEALAEIERLLATEHEDGEVWFLCGRAREALRDVRGAEEAYLRAIERSPGLVEAQFRLGAVLIELARYEEAIASLESALSLAPPDAPWRAQAEAALIEAHQRAIPVQGKKDVGPG
jgi:tetratricopeptide (TPR) repeat protein